ncbi:MAG: hypothetical protein ACTSWY_06975 [Promethearchaeota archaeon]
MSENAVSSGILQTSSIIITIIVVTASFTVAYGISAAITSSGSNFSRQLNTDFEVIGIGDVNSTDTSFMIFLKNTGTEEIKGYAIIDVFFNGNYFEFNSSDTSVKRWSVILLSDINNNNYWGQYDTMGINLTLDSGNQLGTGAHEIRISIYGNIEKYTFSV